MIFGLYGAGGFGREVMPMLQRRKWSAGIAATFDEFVFIETNPSASVVDGVRVVSENEFTASQFTHFAIAIANSKIRSEIAERLEARNKIPLTVTSELASISPIATIAPGGIFCDFSTVTANANIGRHFHGNFYSYVPHDCRLGDYVTFAPAVRCNGNVHIGSHAYLGTGAIVKQGRPAEPMTIGAEATVGMGAVVTKPVAPGTTVVGNPARVLQRGSGIA